MKKNLILLVLICISISLSAQKSEIDETKKVYSNNLKKEVKYSIYLPEGYKNNNREYPVLYLLHGYGGDHTSWIQTGEVQKIADKEISRGKATPMIIVMPDAEGGWYVNNESGDYKYEDFFIKELIPHIEKTYKCRIGKQFRAVAGLSMGGYGSLLYALKYPDLFDACCPLSSGVVTDEEILNQNDDTKKVFAPVLGSQKSKVLSDQWKKNSVLELVKKFPEDKKNSVKFYIDCGDDDFLYKGNAALHVAMRDNNIPHEFRMRDGGHTWLYWRTALPQVLKFVSSSFHR